MNLAPSPVHRGLGMPPPGPLSMAGFGATSPFSPPAVHHHHHHQRSPFGIQELLGLSQHAVSAAAATAAAHEHGRTPLAVPVSHDSVISAVTSYIPRSLCPTPVPPPSTAPTTHSVLTDRCAPHAFSSWRANFMQFAGAHGQNMFSQLANTSPASTANGFVHHQHGGGGSHTDNSSGQ